MHILERLWWRLDRALDADTLRASARYYIAHALLSGTTTLFDHHESPAYIEGSLDTLAEACTDLGMRALLCYGATERNFGGDEARRGLAECARFAKKSESPLVRGVIGLHAGFTVSDDTIRRTGDLCRELGCVLHIHVAEDLADVEDAIRRGYGGALDRVTGLADPPKGTLIAHGVHLTNEELALAEAREFVLVHNPRSNDGNKVGYAHGLRGLTRVALGTDGYPANMAEEIAHGSRCHPEDASAFPRREAFGHDVVRERFGPAWDTTHDSVLRDESGRVVEVSVCGRVVVRDGELVGAKLAEIEADARRARDLLAARMNDLP